MNTVRLLSPIFSLAALMLSVGACAMWNKALDDPYKRWTLFNEPAGIHLRCTEELMHTNAPSAQTPRGNLVIRETPTHPAPKVGDFGDMPIYLEGEKANAVLFGDVQRILLDTGYSAVDEGAEDEAILEATMTMLWADMDDTYAAAGFVASLNNAAGILLWKGVFKGRDDYRERDEYKNRGIYNEIRFPEDALARAYCQSLNSFAQAIREPAFIKAMQQE